MCVCVCVFKHKREKGRERSENFIFWYFTSLSWKVSRALEDAHEESAVCCAIVVMKCTFAIKLSVVDVVLLLL